jgi:putative oxidoreductase
MFKKFYQFFDNKAFIAPIFIRLLIGFHLVYGTHDKVFDPTAMRGIGQVFESLHIPLPLFSAYLSAGAQLICGVLFLLGAWVRPAAAVMVFNFVVAILAAHLGDKYPAVFPAWAMLCGALFLLFNGAGAWSVEGLKK